MKLLRLTSDSADGSFDCFLNQEIDLQPKAQIALQSAIFEASDKTLTITADNNKIQFQTAAVSGLQTVYLDASGQSIYDSNNIQVFFDDMNNKINESFSISNPNQIGKQFQITDVSSDGKVKAIFKTSAYSSSQGELGANSHTTTVNGVASKDSTIFISNSGLLGSASNTDNSTGLTKYNFFSHYTTPISKGAAIYRHQVARLTRLSDGGAGFVSGGFTMALSASTPAESQADGHFTDDSFAAMIQVLEQDAGNTATYRIKFGTNPIVNTGIVVDTGLYAAGDVKNDQIEIVVDRNTANQGRDLVINLYRRNAGNTEWIKTELGRTTYTAQGENPVDLYAYSFIHGATVSGAYNCRLGIPRFTADPFKVATPTKHLELETPLGDDIVSDVKPEPPKNPNTIHSINFVSESVYEWLGFNTGQQPSIQSSQGIVTFSGDNLFGSKIIADAFIIQLLNLPVEAYDTFGEKQGRENILAVIPQTDENLRVIYEANGLYFIELNNANAIKLSNIRARIVRQDYSLIQTRGLSSLVLFVKDMM
jgi:hypothetical protein